MPDLPHLRLGTILVAIGDGLVIPKMKEFGLRFPGSLDSTWLKLEGLKTDCFICYQSLSRRYLVQESLRLIPNCLIMLIMSADCMENSRDLALAKAPNATAHVHMGSIGGLICIVPLWNLERCETYSLTTTSCYNCSLSILVHTIKVFSVSIYVYISSDL